MARVTRHQKIDVLAKEIKKRQLIHEDVAAAIGCSTGNLSNFLTKKLKRDDVVDNWINQVATFLGWKPQDVIARAMLADVHGLESAKHCMFLGDNLSLWYSRVGNGVTPIKEENIDLIYEPSPAIELPVRVERLLAKVRSEHAQKVHKFTNNPLLTITGGETSAWHGASEEFYVQLILGSTEYACLFALRRTPDGKKLLKEYIESWSPDILFDTVTGQGLGVNVVVVSSDNQMIFGRRSDKVDVRKGQLDVGTVEGFSLSRDVGATVASGRTRFEMKTAAFAALEEEVGITKSKILSVDVLNFGFDLQYSQWNFIALAMVDLTAREIRNRHRAAASQGIEYQELEWIGCDAPDRVFRFVASDAKPFWSCGLAAIYYSLVRLHGIDPVESALRGIRFRDPDGFLWD